MVKKGQDMVERRYRSASPEQTRRLGVALGQIAPAGLVLAIEGDLGAGKTVLVGGLAEGLGQTAVVQSPTFTIQRIYADPAARLPLYHFDCYRLSDGEDFRNAGLDEYLTAGGVSVLEWAEIVREVLPADSWWMRLERQSAESPGWTKLADGTIVLATDDGLRLFTLRLPESFAEQLDRRLDEMEDD